MSFAGVLRGWKTFAVFCFCTTLGLAQGAVMPLPEHPRPDFERAKWINLNGAWDFAFDQANRGVEQGWAAGQAAFPLKITVPFSWGSKLSGVPDQADIGWYARDIRIPEDWKGKRIFLVIGASDWVTEGWLDGQKLGRHQGGYTPFSFELPAGLAAGSTHRLVLRVDDAPHPFKLEGKQGYGQARGMWQTPYLEARGSVYLDQLHFTPDIDKGEVKVVARLSDAAAAGTKLNLRFTSAALPEALRDVPKGAKELTFTVPVPRARLWSLEDPFLYEVEASLGDADRVATYFGMRKIGVIKLPGTGDPYVALNNRPIYLQLALDQSYHPEGFYTFPSDAFMKEEILRAKRLGLNGVRSHIKLEVPRKLYWADRLGLLVMEDVPNFWGEPDEKAKAESEFAMKGMIARDYNHPAIFSWVLFNETWGLFSKDKVYAPETQKWVISVYEQAKRLDPTRLVEDNSPCNLDHVKTDINTWHMYAPGNKWKEFLDNFCRDTYPGSGWNYVKGYVQGAEPMFNSECGNVWGYEGSTGDVDWSYDYHIMMNEFRRHPRNAGWLYTELHDVINEWNGYYKADRTEKETGLSELWPGMSLLDLHAPYYVSAGDELCQTVKPGEQLQVPLWISFLGDEHLGSALTLECQAVLIDRGGRRRPFFRAEKTIPFQSWTAKKLDETLALAMPAEPGLVILGTELRTPGGAVLQRNFTTFRVKGSAPQAGAKVRELSFKPASFQAAQWTGKQWNVLDGLKVNGAGSGYFEYRLPWPAGLKASDLDHACFRAELSAKRLLGKDKDLGGNVEDDFMRGKGTQDPGRNPNAYPMTGVEKYPSSVRVRVAGQSAGSFLLPDDPADHRGILSWASQKQDRKLREAGSYGYLVEATLPRAALEASEKAGEIVLRLEVDAALAGGLAIYGEDFGRYPFDPTLELILK